MLSWNSSYGSMWRPTSLLLPARASAAASPFSLEVSGLCACWFVLVGRRGVCLEMPRQDRKPIGPTELCTYVWTWLEGGVHWVDFHSGSPVPLNLRSTGTQPRCSEHISIGSAFPANFLQPHSPWVSPGSVHPL